MAEIFAIEVLRVRETEAALRFRVLHPTQWDIPAVKNLALQAIVDAYAMERDGYLLGEQPLPRDAMRRLAIDHPCRDQLEHWFELVDGREIVITKEEFDLLERDEASRRDVSAWGGDAELGYFKKHMEYGAFYADAERAIVEVRLEDEVAHPKRADFEPDPEATMVLRVADARWLSHLVPGMTWDSAIYDYEGWI
jgi:hypothetical protein